MCRFKSPCDIETATLSPRHLSSRRHLYRVFKDYAPVRLWMRELHSIRVVRLPRQLWRSDYLGRPETAEHPYLSCSYSPGQKELRYLHFK